MPINYAVQLISLAHRTAESGADLTKKGSDVFLVHGFLIMVALLFVSLINLAVSQHLYRTCTIIIVMCYYVKPLICHIVTVYIPRCFTVNT